MDRLKNNNNCKKINNLILNKKNNIKNNNNMKMKLIEVQYSRKYKCKIINNNINKKINTPQLLKNYIQQYLLCTINKKKPILNKKNKLIIFLIIH